MWTTGWNRVHHKSQAEVPTIILLRSNAIPLSFMRERGFLFVCRPISLYLDTMKLSSLLGHTREVLQLVRDSGRPADSLIDTFFRTHKYLGSHDRRLWPRRCTVHFVTSENVKRSFFQALGAHAKVYSLKMVLAPRRYVSHDNRSPHAINDADVSEALKSGDCGLSSIQS